MSLIDFFFPTAPEQQVALVVNCLITVVGSWSLFEIWRAFRAATREVAVVVDAVRVLSAPTESLKEMAVEQRTALVRKSCPPDSLLMERLTLLEGIREAGDDPDTASLAGQLLAALDRRLGLARWAANAVVLLGLGGTLFGLAKAVESVKGLITDSSALVLQDTFLKISGTFAGLSTAFSTTLWGILFALAIGASLAMLRRQQTALALTIEQASLRYLYPQFRSSPSDALSRAAHHLAEIEGRLQKSLETVVEKLGSVVQGVKEQGVSLISTVDRSFTTLTDEARVAAKAQSEHWNAILAQQYRLLGKPEEVSVTLPSVAAQLKESASSVQILTDRVGEILPAVEEVIARQVDRQARDLHETMHAYTQRLSDAVERQEEGVRDQLSRMESHLPTMETHISGALRGHETALTENLGPAIGALTESLRGSQESTRLLSESLSRLAMLNDRVDATLRAARDVGPTSSSKDADRIIAAIARLEERLDSSATPRAIDRRELPHAPAARPQGADATPPEPSPPPTTGEPEGLMARLSRKLFS